MSNKKTISEECADVLELLAMQIHERPLFDIEERREFISALRYAISGLRMQALKERINQGGRQ